MQTSFTQQPQTDALKLAERGGETWKHGDHDGARALLTEARQLAEAAEDKHALATVLYHLGELAYIRAAFMQAGDPQQAMDYHQQALALREEIGDQSGTALSLSRIGVLHERTQDFDRAVECFERALSISEEIGFPRGTIRPYTHMAAHHRRNGDPKTALALDQKSLEISEEIDDQESIVFGLTNLAGAAYRLQGDTETAIKHFRRALTIAEKRDFKLASGRIYHDLASVHQREGDLVQALAYLEKLSQMAHAVNYKMLSGLADRRIAEIKNKTEK